MKKFLGIFIAVAMILSISVCAAPTLLWDFGEDSDIEDSMGGKSAANTLDFYAEGDYEVFIASGNDPYVSIDTPMDSVDQVLWCKVCVKNESPATAIELFAHTNGRDLTGSECTHIDIEPNMTEFKTFTCYIPTANVETVNAYKDPQYAIDEFYWEGTVEWIRLDPMWQEGDDGSDAGGSMSDGDTIKIDWIAFFSSEADMNAYNGPKAAETPAEAAPAEAPAEAADVVVAPAAQTADLAVVAIVALGALAAAKKH